MTDTQQLDAAVSEFKALFNNTKPDDFVILSYAYKFKAILSDIKAKNKLAELTSNAIYAASLLGISMTEEEALAVIKALGYDKN